VFGKRTNPPVKSREARAPAVSPTAAVVSRRPAAYGAIKRAILVALAEAIEAARIGQLDAESAREEIRDLASEIIASKNIVMSIAEQEDLLDDICNDVFR
jgi:pilus assembly protein CpaF